MRSAGILSGVCVAVILVACGGANQRDGDAADVDVALKGVKLTGQGMVVLLEAKNNHPTRRRHWKMRDAFDADLVQLKDEFGNRFNVAEASDDAFLDPAQLVTAEIRFDPPTPKSSKFSLVVWGQVFGGEGRREFSFPRPADPEKD